MKRFIRWSLIVVLGVLLISAAVMVQQYYTRHADASDQAIAAAQTDDNVAVQYDGDLSFRPRHVKERLGVIVYPGAYTDIRGYAPVLKRVAAAGYRVIVTSMPFELAILGTNQAAAVIAANRDIDGWVIVGHSVGGAAAAVFTTQNPGVLDGVIIWDSYPPSVASLAAYQKPVWHIHRATPDAQPPDSFLRQRALFPSNSRWVPVPGGIHMNFGSFTGGGYQEDWPATISQSAQHDIVVAATLEALADIESNKKGGS